MNHVMIDLETLGQQPGCVIISLNAVQFDLETGEIGKQFNRAIELESQLNAGLTIDADTFLWWMKQSDESRSSLVKDIKKETFCKIGHNLQGALYDFTRWMVTLQGENKYIPKSTNDNLIVWGRGPRFDLAILAYAYKIINSQMPWNFRNERCVRTMEMLCPALKVQLDKQRTSTLHNGIDDCLHQIKYVSEIFKTIK